jgi:hypothetical protein
MFFPSSLYQLIGSQDEGNCGNDSTIFPHLHGEVSFLLGCDFDGSGGSLGNRLSISSVCSKSSSMSDSQSHSPTFGNKKKRKMREHGHPTGLDNTRNSRQINYAHGAIRIAQKRLKDDKDEPRQG